MSRRENYDCYVNPTESAKLTSLLEKTSTSFREGDLQVIFLGYFLNLNLLATHAWLFVHHCENMYTSKKTDLLHKIPGLELWENA
jgi:hypothetical protein